MYISSHPSLVILKILTAICFYKNKNILSRNINKKSCCIVKTHDKKFDLKLSTSFYTYLIKRLKKRF